MRQKYEKILPLLVVLFNNPKRADEHLWTFYEYLLTGWRKIKGIRIYLVWLNHFVCNVVNRYMCLKYIQEHLFWSINEMIVHFLILLTWRWMSREEFAKIISIFLLDATLIDILKGSLIQFRIIDLMLFYIN